MTNKRTDLIYALFHIPIDVLAITTAFIVSYILRGYQGNGIEIYHLPYNDYLHFVNVAVPLWIFVFMLEGLYTSRYLFGTLQNLSRIAVSVLAGWASFVVYLTFLKTEQTFVFPRLMLLYILILGFVFVFAGRLLLRFIQFLVRSAGIGRRRILLFGQGKGAENLEQVLQNYNDVGIKFVKRVEQLTITELEAEIKKYKIDELIIDDNTLKDNEVLDYLRVAQKYGVVCHLVPNMFEVQSSNVLFHTLAGTPLLTFRQTPLEGWGRIVKRVLDIILSILTLVLLSPVFLLIAIIIMISDPGPVFYPHERIARGGKRFKIYKFRTMILKYCTGSSFNPKSQIDIFKELGREDLIEEFKRDHKVKDDPRISRIGKFLRKTSLDELPQLINVLRGDLSLVGPRPIVEEELSRYGHWSSYLLSIKPGMTGLWQVSGRNDVTYDERVQIDIHYVQNWSLWQDFVIILKTGLTILGVSHGY